MCNIRSARAQESSAQTGTIEGTVSTQSGTVKLPGVLVSVRGASDQEVAQQVSDDTGHFVVTNLPVARYRVLASLDGFQSVESEAVVSPGAVANLTLDLPIAAVSEHVDVKATAPVFEAETLASSEQVAASETQVLAPGQGVPAALRLMTGVIEVPGGDSIDGGRPFQSGTQLGAATLIDPATNLARVPLPDNGIDTVSVLPNPYEVEFGRFSSGLVVIQTKRAADHWKIDVGNLEPALRLKRFTLLNVTGVTVWQPDVEIGGPLVKGRVFLQQTAQYHYQTIDIPSRPEIELKYNRWFSSLTRVDANLSPRHSLVVAGGFVPSSIDQELLGTFIPPDATVNINDDVGHGMVTERALLGKATAVETTLEYHQYRTGVSPQGPAPMTLLPETTLGNFYNIQHRNTSALQWIETASHSYTGLGGVHLLKVGADVLHSSYDGTSDSRPVLIDRSDGTLARRLDFDGPTAQSVDSTDVGVFAQDRFQPVSRASIEFGGRLDHDGITDHASVTPRVGVAVRLNRSGTATLHGGWGLFYERTPSVAGAFEQFEEPVDIRFDADGLTPLGPPVLYAHLTAPGLQPARSSTWDVAYDHHVNAIVSVHVGVLDRDGSHQLIVEPVQALSGAAYVMSSSGRSHYRQQEVSVHIGRDAASMNASYVHSSARESLNTLLNFFDVVPQPIIGENAYAPAMADAPNRLLLRGRAMPTPGWLLVATLDWRSGLPYSIVNEDLDFIGPRNGLRFPSYFRVDAGFERRFGVARFHPWVGLRVSNALNSFLPSDVQANINSPAFGSFYNSVYREYRLRIRFEK
ncbi:MAG TPA: TonB-dependent receptor [Vicinamibacterales bacterium]|nr:TonB-dependent receptor [Vicinamibacterales bacterium]